MDVRRQTLAREVEATLALAAGKIAFYIEDYGVERYMALGGQASEFAERNAGKGHRVVECCELGDRFYAWIGFQEQWRRVSGKAGSEFIRGSFTAHIGRRGEAQKPQVLRKEWVGRGSGQYREDIGQPHWQVDVLESLRAANQAHREQVDGAFGEAEVEEVVEFAAGQGEHSDGEMFARMPIERMHLASAARLWVGTSGQLATSPTKVEELDLWILNSLRYIRQEIGRCVFSVGTSG